MGNVFERDYRGSRVEREEKASQVRGAIEERGGDEP